LDIEFAGQAFGAAEVEAQPGARRIAIGERELYVGDARPLIGKGQPDAAVQAFPQSCDTHRAAAIVNGVSRYLAGGGDDFGLVNKAET
jgi:hypothetical protein